MVLRLWERFGERALPVPEGPVKTVPTSRMPEEGQVRRCVDWSANGVWAWSSFQSPFVLDRPSRMASQTCGEAQSIPLMRTIAAIIFRDAIEELSSRKGKPHLNDDGAVVAMGHPEGLGSFLSKRGRRVRRGLRPRPFPR